MNQIQKMLRDSNERLRQIMKGDFQEKIIDRAQREAEIQLKLIDRVIQAYAIDSKNKRTIAAMEKMNLLDTHTAADLGLGDAEVDKVKCPAQETIIYRHECLDYSGSHYGECQGCETGAKTKQLLLPSEKG